MKRLVLSLAVLSLAGCQCGLQPVVECTDGTDCTDAGSGGGTGDGGGAVGGGDADAGLTGGGVATGGGDVGGGTATGGGDADAGTGGGAFGGGTTTGGGSVTGGGATGGGSVTGGGSATGGGSSAADAGSDLCAAMARVKCDYFSRCLMENTDPLVNGRANTLLAANQLANCVAQATGDATCQISQKGVNLGRSNVNASAYSACMTALYPAGTCTRDLNSISSLCKVPLYLQGHGAAGAPCTSDTECVGGSCTITNGAACGVCAPYANADGGVGSRCTRDSMCDPTRSYCPGSDGNPPGGNTTCQSFKALAAQCNQSGTEVQQQEECGTGAVCSGGLVSQNRCTTGKLEGVACTKNSFECARSGRGVTELTCATTGPNTSMCTRAYNTTAGGSCGTGETTGGFNNAPPYCLESEFCSSNVCVNRRVVNQPCTNDTNCQAGLRCSGNVGSRFCVAYGDVGASCTNTNECRGLLTCSGQQCVPTLAALGSPCSTMNNSVPQCAEGYCEGAGSAIGTCTALKADGVTCARNSQCQSYSCNTTCAHACWQD